MRIVENAEPPRAAGWVSAVVNSYRPHAVLPRHDHSGASLSLVFDGHYIERIGRRSWHCRPLSLVYKPPQVDHSNHVGASGLRAMFVEVPQGQALSLMSELPNLNEVRCNESPAARSLVRRMGELVAQRGRTGFALRDDMLHVLLLAVLHEDARRPGRDRGAWLTHVREFLHANYRRPLALADVAAVGGVHPVHLAQSFRRRFGCTVHDYVRCLRLEAARADLRDMTRTIGTIGLAAGFADHAHFSRAFRGRFGQTPSQYRRSLA